MKSTKSLARNLNDDCLPDSGAGSCGWFALAQQSLAAAPETLSLCIHHLFRANGPARFKPAKHSFTWCCTYRKMRRVPGRRSWTAWTKPFFGMEASRISQSQDTLSFELDSVGGKYHGTLLPDHKTIRGIWEQGGTALPLKFENAWRDPKRAWLQTPFQRRKAPGKAPSKPATCACAAIAHRARRKGPVDRLCR